MSWTHEDSMTLGDLIRRLESYPREEVFKPGFGGGHSYRGYYKCLAFTPLGRATAGEMLDAARACLGQTFGGWKGGNYKMDAETGCFIAEQGECGEAIRQHFFEIHGLRKRDAARADLELRTKELLRRILRGERTLDAIVSYGYQDEIRALLAEWEARRG